MWRRATTGTMWRLGYSAFLPIGALLRLSARSCQSPQVKAAVQRLNSLARGDFRAGPVE